MPSNAKTNGDRVAIVTNAGGPGIMAADAIERAGLKLARLLPKTQQLLTEQLPSAASAAGNCSRVRPRLVPTSERISLSVSSPITIPSRSARCS